MCLLAPHASDVYAYVSVSITSEYDRPQVNSPDGSKYVKNTYSGASSVCIYIYVYMIIYVYYLFWAV